jgi:hemerythrin-like metal-binding protein
MRLDYWEESMVTGFTRIDNTYRQLAEDLGRLQRAIAIGDARELGNTLGPCIRNLEAHFAYEVGLMREHRYPLVEQHGNTHDAFLRLLRGYETRLLAGENVGRKVTYDLKIWLTNHVKLQDGHFADFTRRNDARGPLRWLGRLLDGRLLD